MLFSAILLSVVVPVSISPYRSTEIVAKPFIVQAVIDSARLMGLPQSKASKAYAIKIQMPDPILQQITYISEPLPPRKLFFRNYFSNGDT